jgi:uncharacterized protein YdhG (YjbR/CyaY superfamily)
MKQTKTVTRTATKAPKKTSKKIKFTTVDEYIATLPAASKNAVIELRKTIRAAAPKAEEVISYNIPAFKLHGMLIWFAGWKEHVSVYPRTALLQAAIKELSAYDGAKGTIKFPLDKPLPLALIKKVVKFRVQENLVRAKEKEKNKK